MAIPVSFATLKYLLQQMTSAHSVKSSLTSQVNINNVSSNQIVRKFFLPSIAFFAVERYLNGSYIESRPVERVCVTCQNNSQPTGVGGRCEFCAQVNSVQPTEGCECAEEREVSIDSSRTLN